MGCVQTGRSAALGVLRYEVRACLERLDGVGLSLRHGPSGLQVGELIGLLLMDLDLLSSRPASGRSRPPEFASEFMDKRLARRLAERYKDRDLAAEVDRRFVVAQRFADQGGPEREPVLARIRSRSEALRSAVAAAEAPG